MQNEGDLNFHRLLVRNLLLERSIAKFDAYAEFFALFGISAVSGIELLRAMRRAYAFVFHKMKNSVGSIPRIVNRFFLQSCQNPLQLIRISLSITLVTRWALANVRTSV